MQDDGFTTLRVVGEGAMCTSVNMREACKVPCPAHVSKQVGCTAATFAGSTTGLLQRCLVV